MTIPRSGDFDEAFAAAPVTVDAAYSTPPQHHNPIELFATQCAWNGAELTVYEPSQNVYGIKNGLATQLGIDPSRIRVISPYIGGAFGSKGALTQRTAIVAIAARRLGRPVKLVPTRDQGFTIATYRAETQHRVKLGASRDGRLQALSHEGFEVTSRPDAYAVAGTDASTRMYACPMSRATSRSCGRTGRRRASCGRRPRRRTSSRSKARWTNSPWRSTWTRSSCVAINDTQIEPIKGLPYTSRALMPCFDQAAEAFG